MGSWPPALKTFPGIIIPNYLLPLEILDPDPQHTDTHGNGEGVVWESLQIQIPAVPELPQPPLERD